MEKAFAFGDKTLDPAVKRINRIQRVAIIGAGTMGIGIAIDLLRKTGYGVILLDVQAEALDKARTRLEEQWAADVKSMRIREQDAETLARRVESLLDRALFSKRLCDHGITPDAIPELAKSAAKQWTAKFNPRPVGPAELAHIYEMAMG